LKDEIDIKELKDDLREVIPLNAGGSFKLLWDMLYHIRLLKYIRRSQLKEIDSRYSKICSAKKLSKLVELGLVKNTYEDVFISSNKSLRLLKQLQYQTQTLPKDISGEGVINELNNTEVFIQALKLPDFIALLYPNFEYLKPDALLVRGTKEKYRLEFLEVEASKSNWNDWLENKRINYLKLAGEKRSFNYWVSQCKLLDLPVPEINDFRFSISIVGKAKKDFGIGFNFMEELCTKI
jgi:hypothetical protein